MVTVEEEENVAAFADFVPPATLGVAPTVTAPKDNVVAAAAVAVAAPPSPPAPKKEAVAPPPAPIALPPPVAAQSIPTIATAAAAPATTTFSTAWGLGVVDASPLAKTLAKEQNAYIANYGTTGQAPILAAS